MLFKEVTPGSRKLSNYLWASIILIGSLAFFIVGISSFFKYNFIPILNAQDILFFPQGLVMCFYGFLGFILSSYLCLIIIWDVGKGYNEFNKTSGQISLFRWGFPGKSRRIQMIYPITDIECLRIETTSFGTNQKLYLKLISREAGKDEILIPLTQNMVTVEELEEKASKLAAFLQIPISYD